MRNIKEITLLTHKILKKEEEGLSIYELQKKTKTSFLTMRNVLDFMKKLDLVSEKKDKSTKRKTRIFYLKKSI